jgi:hypothetical protein
MTSQDIVTPVALVIKTVRNIVQNCLTSFVDKPFVENIKVLRLFSNFVILKADYIILKTCFHIPLILPLTRCLFILVLR